MSEKTYDKANSILELRGISNKRKHILDVIKYHKKSNIVEKDIVMQQVLKELFSTKSDENAFRENFFLRDHVVEEMLRLDQSDYFCYLRYRYSYDIYPSIHKTTKYPPLVQIEPASICNYRCVFCYQTDPRLSGKKNGHMGVMSLDLFKNLIDQLEGNVEGVTLASRGEPTVNKKLPDFLKYMDLADWQQ